MDVTTLIDIFEGELDGAKEDDTVVLPQGTRVTVFLATPGGVLPVTKVDRVTRHTGYLELGSDEGRVFTALDQLLALRVDQEPKKSREVKLGFA